MELPEDMRDLDVSEDSYGQSLKTFLFAQYSIYTVPHKNVTTFSTITLTITVSYHLFLLFLPWSVLSLDIARLRHRESRHRVLISLKQDYIGIATCNLKACV